ncbi:potassium channel family protein [Oceaniglobus ichthyenteri]|uniref:potassium channel family protein n=1 Tax=Oceaniglobus ichthyenteri TaxID=2136177 RepID=UPI000D3D7AB5|nr:TrkA family potassium uptake protein [Oceaniglobus ichthyenteri]
MPKLKTRNFVIIGLGTFGTTVAKELSRFGNYVLGIDRDPVVVNRLANDLSQAVVADATNEAALRELGLDGYDVAVIAMGDDLESSIVSAITVKMAGVPTVWAKATTKMHHRILTKVGVERVIHPEQEIGLHIAQMLHNPLVRDYVSLGNGFHLVNIVVPERMAGKTLKELDLFERFELRCVGLMQGSQFKGRDGDDATLEQNDRLMILGERTNLRRFADTV